MSLMPKACCGVLWRVVTCCDDITVTVKVPFWFVHFFTSACLLFRGPKHS